MSAVFALLVVAVVIAGLAGAAYIAMNPVDGPGPGPSTLNSDVKAFASEDDFKSYLAEAASLSQYGYYGSAMPGAQGQLLARSSETDMAAGEGVVPTSADDGPTEPSRVSGTNVQVTGIDEPDIAKTDGINIYYSGGYHETDIIKAFPPSDLEEISEIEKNGNMLLSGDTLIIFTYDKIYGYDISDGANPDEKWEIEINGSFVDARLYQGKIYLITRNNINPYRPCPVFPVARNGVPVTIRCSSIYHPVLPIQTDVTFNAMTVDPVTGDVDDAVSFVGSTWSSMVYMSENAIYVTNVYAGDFLKIILDFFTEDAADLLPQEMLDELNKLNSYDISQEAKLMEFQMIFTEYLNSLSSDEQMRIQNEMTNRMSDYMDEHKRELVQTGIAKIGLDMEVKSSGAVPGTLLNQFSLDEYEDHLRAAVTVSGTWSMGAESANDVYVLDSQLDIVGSIKDLGLTERVYSARFIGDKGYLVTFRQIDPFYVLDLSDPANPEMKGELKIPGYSSYLHPISNDMILGIGKEDANVKLSLFDVSDPENPAEADKYTMDEYWSDILSTHHAFLMDQEHGIFFLPGGNGGYVFSYGNYRLSLVKAVADISARRAIYMDDYLYILGDNEIVVLDENTWDEINSLELSGSHYPPYQIEDDIVQ